MPTGLLPLRLHETTPQSPQARLKNVAAKLCRIRQPTYRKPTDSPQLRYDSRVGRQANAGDLGDLGEELTDSLLVGVEGQVANEESLAFRADRVAVFLGTVRSTVTGVRLGRPSVGVIEVKRTAVQLKALHSFVSLGGGFRCLKVDVSEATAAAAVSVSDNTSTD
ncbi:hypothetical protein VCV18_005314 [Metarhizium anisopliae]